MKNAVNVDVTFIGKGVNGNKWCPGDDNFAGFINAAIAAQKRETFESQN